MAALVLALPRLQREVIPEYTLSASTCQALHQLVIRLCDQLVETLTASRASAPPLLTDVAALEASLGLLWPEGLVGLAVTAGRTALLRSRAPSSSSAVPSTRHAGARRAGLVLSSLAVRQALADRGLVWSEDANLYWTAVLEFLLTDVLESATEATCSGGRKRVIPQDLYRTVWGDAVPLEVTPDTTSFFSGNADLKALAQRVQWTF